MKQNIFIQFSNSILTSLLKYLVPLIDFSRSL